MKSQIEILQEDISYFVLALEDEYLSEESRIIISKALKNAESKLDQLELDNDIVSESNSEGTYKEKSQMVNSLAQEIRKEGQSWNDAVSFASKIVKSVKRKFVNDVIDKTNNLNDFTLENETLSFEENHEGEKKELPKVVVLHPLEKQEVGNLVLTKALKQRGVSQVHVDKINETRKGIVTINYSDDVEPNFDKNQINIGVRVSRNGLIFSEDRLFRKEHSILEYEHMNESIGEFPHEGYIQEQSLSKLPFKVKRKLKAFEDKFMLLKQKGTSTLELDYLMKDSKEIVEMLKPVQIIEKDNSSGFLGFIGGIIMGAGLTFLGLGAIKQNE